MNRYEQSNQNTNTSTTNTSTEDACSDAVERVLRAVPEILDAMIEKAKSGSQQHAKFLFDWAKLEPSFNDDEEEATPSLAKFLLEKLREDTGESASANTTGVL
jgi:hypothetical protein